MYAVIYLEADDLEVAFKAIGSSDEPFDRWFHEHVLDVHGIALEEGLPAARADPRLRSDSSSLMPRAR